MKVRSRNILLLIGGALAVVLTACGGGGGGGGGGTADTTPPTVSSVFPANGATLSPINTAVSVTFSEAMNATTLTTATFRVSTGGNNVAGTVGYSGAIATFTPSTDLAGNTTYTATITTGAKDAAGNALAANYVWSFTTTPLPRFAYMANNNDNSVSTYVVDNTTGRLKWIGKVAAGTHPNSVTVDPSGQFAYVANAGGNVSQYTIGVDGSLAPMSPATVLADITPQSVTVDPSGQYAYVANTGSADVSAYTINAGTGALTQINCGVGPECSAKNFLAGTFPYSVTVDPSGQFAYVANNGTGDISAYTINAGTGALTQINCGVGPECSAKNFLAGTNPSSVTVDPSGQFAYVANNGTVGDISAYTIDASTGALTQIDCGGGAGCSAKNFLAGTNPSSVTVDPSGQFAYVANNGTVGDVSAYTINASTGALTQIDCGGGAGCNAKNFLAGTNPSFATVDPSGRYVYVANFGEGNVSQYTIGTDGSLKALSPSVAPAYDGPFSITLTQGTASVSAVPKYAYVANNGTVGDISAYTIDASTGALTPIDADSGTGGIQNFPAHTNPVSVTVDPSGKFAYVANNGSDDVSQYTIGSDGSLAPIGTGIVSAGTGPSSVAVDPLGRYAYVANNSSGDVSAYTIDASTGALTQIDCGSGVLCHTKNFLAGTNPFSITVDPSGRFAYVANFGDRTVWQYSIGTDGSLTLNSTVTLSPGSNPISVTVDPSGQFAYVANNGTGDISAYTIDAGTGALTPIDANPGTVPIDNFAAGTNPSSVTVDPSGNHAYVANFGDGNASAYTIDAITGALTQIDCGSGPECNAKNFLAGTNPNSVTVDPSGKYAYVANYDSANNSNSTVSQYTIGASGSLKPMSTATVASGIHPSSVVTIGTWQ